MKKSIAVFDIDGTIFRSSLLIRLVNEWIKKNDKFSERAKKQFYQWTNELYYGKRSFDEYINSTVEAYKEWIKGLPYAIHADIAEEVAESHTGLVFKYPVELFKHLKSKGKHYMVAISHSPFSIVEHFCNMLGFDKVYATNYKTKIENGQRVFTGEVNLGIFDQNKANAFEEVVKEHDLESIGSVGIGDSEADIKFLEKVNHPIAFNPDAKLEEWAKDQKNNSEIIFEDAQKLRIRYYKGRHYFPL